MYHILQGGSLVYRIEILVKSDFDVLGGIIEDRQKSRILKVSTLTTVSISITNNESVEVQGT